MRIMKLEVKGFRSSMLPIVAEYARDAANRSQVILTTHSPEFLDAFGTEPPTTTVAEWINGETMLRVVSGDDLGYWLGKYSLGELFRSKQLESMQSEYSCLNCKSALDGNPT